MTVSEIKDELNDLVGVNMLYNNKLLVIERVKELNGRITIYSNQKTFVMFPADAVELLSKISEAPPGVNSEIITVKTPIGNVAETYKNNADKVTDALMQQLELISSNSSVSQAQLDKAKAMSQIANTVVNVEKIKIDYLTLMRK